MPTGTLEVLLGNAKGLEDTNFLTSMNPYVLITCRTQEKKSSVADGEGSEPEWNETFLFTISRDVEEITLRIMDKDTFSSDDFVGEATIPLNEVFRLGEVPTKSYNVVKDEEFCGEIKVGLTFTAEPGSVDRGCDEEDYGGRSRKSRCDDEEDYGGSRRSREHSRGRGDDDDYGSSRRSREHSRGRDDDDDYGGCRKTREHSRGRDDDDDYGGCRRSREHSRGRDEDNYGGYRESRDDY